MSETPLGRICWHELLTNDVDGACEFYGRVAGWETSAGPPDGPPYTLWTNKGTPIGGVMSLPEEVQAQGVPPHWLAYISTPDLAATVEKANGFGVVVLHEMELPSVGKFALMAKPGKEVFTAFQPEGDTPGHDGEAAIGEVSWNELLADDDEAAWAFYSALFGWEEMQKMDMGDAGTYRVYGRKGVELGGIMKRPEAMPHPAWLFYIRVTDVRESVELVRELNGTVTLEPTEVPGGDFIVQGRDPQGAAFALHSA